MYSMYSNMSSSLPHQFTSQEQVPKKKLRRWTFDSKISEQLEWGIQPSEDQEVFFLTKCIGWFNLYDMVYS